MSYSAEQEVPVIWQCTVHYSYTYINVD